MRAVALALLNALAGVLLVTPAFGRQVPSAGSWQPGPDATGDNTYLGAIDTPTNGASIAPTSLVSVSGWFVDTTAQGWAGADDVQLFVGPIQDGRSIGHAAMGVSRPDVAASLGNPYWAAAGWQAAIDPGALPAGQTTLSVNVHTPSKGWWSLQLGVVVQQIVSSSGEPLAAAPALQGNPPVLSVRAPVDGETVTTRSRSYPITGSARDATVGPRGIDWVEVWLNGEANSDTGVFLGVADLTRDGSWSLPFDPGAHLPINSNLYVYAHSAVNGKKSLVVRHFFLADRPL